MDNMISDESNELVNAVNKVAKSIKEFTDAMCELFKAMGNKFTLIFYGLKNYLNKKISKKRFIKLLQSEGIQRNTINAIIKDNREPYTYMRYYETLQKFER